MPRIHIQTIRRAILDGRYPADIAQKIKDPLRIFLVEPSLFDQSGLQGSAKHAELVVKLGYWLAKGQLTENEFRIWADCIPPEDNAGWDVDLLPAAPGSPLRHVLKMGPLGTPSEACLVQETSWVPPPRHEAIRPGSEKGKRMLQKLLLRTIGTMAGAGLLGMFAAYLICGEIESQYVGFGSVFAPSRPMPEGTSISQAEWEGLRNKILAGGCAGVLLGLGTPAWSARSKT